MTTSVETAPADRGPDPAEDEPRETRREPSLRRAGLGAALGGPRRDVRGEARDFWADRRHRFVQR